MKINGVVIEDTFAEAFPVKATRIVVTAMTNRWAMHAARAATGFATSVIGCGCEAAIERNLEPEETPDGRPGISILLFAMGKKSLTKQLENRTGQCLLTCPTTSVFAGIESEKNIPLAKNLRFFGDGYQTSKQIGGKRYWRIPVMHGEFVGEETTGMVEAVGGGNFLILAETTVQALAAAELAVEAIQRLPNVIMPFPGGVVCSGSKVGSKYENLDVSVNDAFCPTISGITDTHLPAAVASVMEIVIDGLTEADINAAMREGIRAACSIGAGNGILQISAGNYGGKLGPFHFKLQEIVA